MAATRKFVEESALFGYLLDRFEDGVASPVAYPDHDGFSTVTAADAFQRGLQRAQEAGCIVLVEDRGRFRGRLKFVRLADPDALYARIGRAPASRTASAAGTAILQGLQLHPAIEAEVRNAIGAWSRNRSWFKLGPDQAANLRTAIELAQAILDSGHAGLDYRTFSRRTVGDSKALERLEGAVVKLISATLDRTVSTRPRAALAALGLDRFPPPFLLSGSWELDGSSISASLPYVGLPPAEVDRIVFLREPEYILTVENFASFNRHVTDADSDRRGLTIYTGGYPSIAAQAALKRLGSIISDEVPFYHWSDIDPDGVMIFRTVELALNRPLLPHLMNIDLVERHGETPKQATRLKLSELGGSAIEKLAHYMAGSGYKVMEQEELDPEIPGLRAPAELMLKSPQA